MQNVYRHFYCDLKWSKLIRVNALLYNSVSRCRDSGCSPRESDSKQPQSSATCPLTPCSMLRAEHFCISFVPIALYPAFPLLLAPFPRLGHSCRFFLRKARYPVLITPERWWFFFTKYRSKQVVIAPISWTSKVYLNGEKKIENRDDCMLAFKKTNQSTQEVKDERYFNID